MFHNSFIRTSQRHSKARCNICISCPCYPTYGLPIWSLADSPQQNHTAEHLIVLHPDRNQQYPVTGGNNKKNTIGSKQFPNANWIEPVGISCCHFCILFPSLLRPASSHTMWHKYVCRANEWDPFQAHLLYANSPWRANLKSEFANEKLPRGFRHLEHVTVSPLAKYIK